MKMEISKARIQMIEPIVKGSAGLEYLQKAFNDRYGPPSSAATALTQTKLWLSPLKNIADEEWNEYVDSLSLLPERDVRIFFIFKSSLNIYIAFCVFLFV